MFPLTHLYAAKTILGYENARTALGALFPDYGTYLGLGRNLCHEMGVDMYHYARERDVSHLDFTLGVLIHGTALPGIDYYADEEYHGVRPGFCFQKGQAIAGEVAAACKLPSHMALWKTHNIIELGFDIVTERRCSRIAKTLIAALPVEGQPFCSDFLSDYLNLPNERLREMFTVVSGFYGLDGTDIDGMAEKFIASLERRHNIIGCNRDYLVELINKAAEIVDPLYDDFMAETAREIKAKLQTLTGIILPSA